MALVDTRALADADVVLLAAFETIYTCRFVVQDDSPTFWDVYGLYRVEGFSGDGI